MCLWIKSICGWKLKVDGNCVYIIQKWLCNTVAANSLLTLRLHRRQPTRLLCPWESPGKNAGVGCHFLLQCMKVKSEREVAQSSPTLHNPMDCSTPGLPVHHQLPKLAQTHVHGIGDAIQSSHPLLSPSPPAFNFSQHQGLFK